MSAKTYDVLIAGAGPVGMFLACELGLARGLKVAILERDPDYAKTPNPWKTGPFGNRGINTLSAESFHRRGLLSTILGPDAWATRPMDFNPDSGLSGHFAGMRFNSKLVDRSAACWKYKLPGPSLCPSPTSLQQIQDALLERVAEHGIQVIGGADVTSVRQDDNDEGVEVQTRDGQAYRANWLVGCDGGRSRVRKTAGFDFVGTEPELVGWYALCDLEDPQKRMKRGFVRTSSGMYAQFFPGSLIIMEPTQTADRSRKDSLTQEEFESIVHRVTGINDLKIKELKLTTSFTDRSKQATTYRKGRVLLAGDSAHIHSPLGGQGLNAGIGDAMNLGWKLASIIKGRAPADLLDSYEKERHPVGAWVTDWTRAQVATLKPDPHGRAVANVIKDLIDTKDGVTHMMSRFWGLTTRYDLQDHDDDELHPLIGCSAPDFDFSTGISRLGERMRSGRGMLINFGGHDDTTLRDLTARWDPDVDYITDSAKEQLGLRALLVRPDGIVAWIAEAETVPDYKSAEEALRRWFGPGRGAGNN